MLVYRSAYHTANEMGVKKAYIVSTLLVLQTAEAFMPSAGPGSGAATSSSQRQQQQRRQIPTSTKCYSLPSTDGAMSIIGSRSRHNRAVSVASRLYLRRDELPEESVRQLEAADRRVKELEQEYWKSLDKEELAIERKCASGLAHLKMGLLDKAAEDYIAAAELRWVHGEEQQAAV